MGLLPFCPVKSLTFPVHSEFRRRPPSSTWGRPASKPRSHKSRQDNPPPPRKKRRQHADVRGRVCLESDVLLRITPFFKRWREGGRRSGCASVTVRAYIHARGRFTPPPPQCRRQQAEVCRGRKRSCSSRAGRPKRSGQTFRGRRKKITSPPSPETMVRRETGCTTRPRPDPTGLFFSSD